MTSFEMHNFQEDVLDASETVPVLVDFWAEWCGPCRVLGPVLERLSAEAGDRWNLVKIDSDKHGELAQQYRVRGIPAVKLFWHGEVIDEFTGALPEHAVRSWLEKALPSPVKELMSQAEVALTENRSQDAADLLASAYEIEPDNVAAKILLASVIVHAEPERARVLIEGTSPSEPGLVASRDAVQQILRLGEIVSNSGSLPDDTGSATYLASAAHATAGRWDDALAGFIEVVGENRYYDEDGARKACIAIFTLLGPGHEVTRKYRRLFDMALY